ncbi:hypothetical protein ATCC90586_010229 [Pythium insidiosum]|nr:hypothetical protein ATCC90586_010229 [Pythium insidiosum]
MVRDYAKNDMKPARIQSTLIDNLELNPDTVPGLTAIQNCVRTFRRKYLSNSDKIIDIKEVAAKYAYSLSRADYEPTSLGFEVDCMHQPILGDGSDEKPFILGFALSFD